MTNTDWETELDEQFPPYIDEPIYGGENARTRIKLKDFIRNKLSLARKEGAMKSLNLRISDDVKLSIAKDYAEFRIDPAYENKLREEGARASTEYVWEKSTPMKGVFPNGKEAQADKLLDYRIVSKTVLKEALTAYKKNI